MYSITLLQSKEDIINRGIYLTAVHVGEKLLNQEYVHLPFVHKVFSGSALRAPHSVNLCLGEKSLVTAQCILFTTAPS